MIAKKSIPLNFTPGENHIGRGKSAPTVPKFYYVLSTAKTGDLVVFSYSYHGQPRSLGSGPLDIPIYYPCCINLQLGGDTKWEFRYDKNDKTKDALTLGDPKYSSYYSNLNHISKTELEFEAELATKPAKPADAQHGFNLYINLYQQAGANPTKIPIKIDPDIINPGVHPFVPRPAGRRAKPKNRSKRS